MPQYGRYGGGGSNPPTDPAANVGGLRTLGTGALQAAAGNDPRFNPSFTNTLWQTYGRLNQPTWFSLLNATSAEFIRILYFNNFLDFDYGIDSRGLMNFGGGGFVPNYYTAPLPTITTQTAAGLGAGPDTYNRIRLVGGTAANEPAGLFSDVAGTVFNRNSGYLLASRVSRRTNTLGTRGGMLMTASAFGGSFEPSAAPNSWGFTYDSTDAVATGWFFHCRGIAGTLQRTAIAAAVRDDTAAYEAYLLADSVTNGTGIMRAVLVRLLATPTVVFDQQITGDLPDPAANCFIEVNASPGVVSGPAQTLDIMRIWGKRGN